MDIAATFDREPFRHTDPKYKCCCGLMHVKQGCKIIAVLGVISVILKLLSLIFEFNNVSWWTFTVNLILLAIVAVVVFCLIWAIKTENEKLLLPYLAYLAVAVIFCLVLFFASFWSLIDPHSPPARIANNILLTRNDTMVEDQGMEEHQTGIRVTSALGITLAVIGIAFCVWFGLVVYKYYVYLKNMKEARNPKKVVHHEISTLKKGMQ